MEELTSSINSCDDDSVDKISDLPDVILHHILSFLDSKFAVQTSILSKRWRYIWVSHPFLNFNPKHLNRNSSFKGLINHVLCRRDSSVPIFHCDFKYPALLRSYNFTIMSKVVKYVASHGIQQLRMDGFELRFLYHLCSCPSLQSLELKRASSDMNVLPKIFLKFATLTTLNIEYCAFSSRASVLSPFEGCPKLTNLRLHRCMILDSVNSFEISAPQLKSLTISRIRHHKDRAIKIVLSSRKLIFFEVTHKHLLFDCSAVELPLLERVNVDLSRIISWKAIELELLANMFNVLCNAKFLTLSFSSERILSTISNSLNGQPSPFRRIEIIKVAVLRLRLSLYSIKGNELEPVQLNVSTDCEKLIR
ncbi:hypothetical protein L6164_036186 [Bauhinia variegata]|uniref:Uncharacterized protein n=1 Tax=Bauhinia variegata TaxID=167791 RepID=A0ACB9KGF4_BAUVA|nr:hypothetical protein L6164_036186 [Bauhinia variegata]